MKQLTIQMLSRLCCTICMLLYMESSGQFFEDIAGNVGFLHQYEGGEYGGGLSFCDFDHDGWDDISLCQNNGAPLFLKNVNGQFIALESFIANVGEMKQITWVDFDNDGDRDLFATTLNQPYRLLENQGDLTFIDITVLAGFPITEDRTYGNSWSDYDRDGDLDVYISNYNGPGMGDPTVTNYLYRNNGDGTFTNQTNEAGVSNGTLYTFMSLWLDYNKDMWPDLMVINDRYTVPNNLYLNNGDGTFTDVSVQAGLLDYICSMSNTSDDYDNDGDLDLYISNTTLGNRCERNNGDGTFTNVADAAGCEINRFCWSAQFLDADNDSWQDLNVCTTPYFAQDGQNQFLKNVGGTFIPYSNEAGMADAIGWNRGSAIGDVNNDGYPDIAIMGTAPTNSSLWIAATGNNNWMKIELEGTISNRDGISSWIECYAGGNKYSRYTYCGEAYLAQNSFNEFFGLAQYSLADSIIVRWTSGIVDTWYNVPVNQQLHLVEGTSRKVVIEPLGDSLLCGEETIELVANTWSNYQWSDLQDVQQITIAGLSSVVLLATDEWGNDFLSDSIHFNLQVIPEVIELVENPLCYESATGSVELTGIFEVPSQTILWNDILYEGLSISGLHAGEYIYRFFDEVGCEVMGSVILLEPSVLVAQVNALDALCFGDSGSVSIEISGGAPGYQINWMELDSTALITGDYLILFQDDNGCASSTSFTILEPDEISYVATTNDVVCFGEQTGSIELNVVGGTGLIQSDFMGSNPDSLFSGNYSCILSDENLCSVFVSFSISEPLPISTFLTLTPEFEVGILGSAIADVEGGTSPYQYSWDNSFSEVSAIAGLNQGDYLLIVKDGNGCLDSTFYTIDFVAQVQEVSDMEFSIFPNPVQGELTVVLSNSSLKNVILLYSTDGKLLFTEIFSGNKYRLSVSSLQAGYYYVVVSDESDKQFSKIIRIED